MDEHRPIAGANETVHPHRSIPHRRFRENPLAALSRRGFGPRLPWGLAGTLLLIGLIEFSIARAASVFHDTVCFSWAFSAHALKTEAVRREILCLGDSLVKHGLVSSVIEAGTGRTAYNLSAAAGPAPITEILFRRILDEGARPRAIVFDLKPSMLAASPRYRMRQWQEILTTPEAIVCARRAGGTAFAVELFLGRCLPSFRARQQIRAALVAALQGKIALDRYVNQICSRNWGRNAGSHIVSPNPGFTGRLTEQQQKDVLSHRFKVHRVNDSAARRIVELAAAEQIRLYLLVPPFAPEVVERRVRTGVDAQYDEFLRALQARNPQLTVLDARHSGYPASVFIDATHINGRGAISLSRDLAAFLKQDLARNVESLPKKRWLQLPPYTEAPAGLVLEDTDRSREALGLPVTP